MHCKESLEILLPSSHNNKIKFTNETENEIFFNRKRIC